MSKWYENCYARLLIDNHITEDDPSFMACFDPITYVAMVKNGGFDSSMVYACCHNGNCYYPTKIGHMHKNLNGRDIFGQTVTLLRKEGIRAIAYYTVVFHNHAAKNNEKWGMADCIGQHSNGRYWFCCPNNPEYKEFAKSQIGEVIEYDVDGIFVDMTFWSTICFCYSCRQLYLNETGSEIPETIGWDNPIWLRFQRTREKWLAEFAQEISDFIKIKKPQISVTHNLAIIFQGSYFGQTSGVAHACDYSAGDFYGNKYQTRLGTKVFGAFSKNQPFEYMTSRCVNLFDHTSMKSEDEMVCFAATTLANGGAFLFIDAINPDGTLEPRVYKRFTKAMSRLNPFIDKLKEHRPKLIADTGLYFSAASQANNELESKSLKDVCTFDFIHIAQGDIQVLNEVIGTSIILNKAHIPYAVVTESTSDLSTFKSLIINNALFMSDEETDRIRSFTANGGTVIATGMSSYFRLDGKTSGDFALKDLFGVSYSGRKSSAVHYISSEQDIVCCGRSAPLVTATTARVIAGLAESIFPPNDPIHYASIHSNPPGPMSKYAGLTINSFGKGTCIYLCSPLLAIQNNPQQVFGESLFQKYAQSGLLISTNAPSSVELTILRSTTRNSLLLCFVNYQQELPNIPVLNIRAQLRLPVCAMVNTCTRVSNGAAIEHILGDGLLTLELDRLEIIEMIEIQ